jgi:pyruvate,water dikinase
MTLQFEAPGPGSWSLDRVHGPNGFSPFLVEIGPQALARGFRVQFKAYGAVLSHMHMVPVNGFNYGQMQPAPPDEIPERFGNAEAAWATKVWRADVERFTKEVKPDSRARNRALAAVDVASLSDAELADHLDRCRDNCDLMVERHHLFTITAIAPIGDFLATVLPWGVASPSQLLGLLQGWSEASSGACEELTALADALRADDKARALVDGDDPAAIIEGLRNRPGSVGDATQAVIDFVGLRPVDGFDINTATVIEQPELLVRAIREALDGAPGEDSTAQVAAATEAIRARVPEEHRTTFDDRLAEARHVYHVRDERGLYQDVWAWGIARKAVLEIARRLAAAGRIVDPDDLFHASYTDMRAILRDSAGPSADELAARAKARAALDPRDMPDCLGDPPHPPPPLDGLPPAVARTMTAIGLGMANLFGSSEEPNEAKLARGIGVNEGVYEGTARVLADATELHRLEEGDVLVTQSTTEAFNLALPILGAIVTDFGGLLSHAAIVSREFGLPAVVGCLGATQLIPDGARVRVDAAAGEVHVLS